MAMFSDLVLSAPPKAYSRRGKWPRRPAGGATGSEAARTESIKGKAATSAIGLAEALGGLDA